MGHRADGAGRIGAGRIGAGKIGAGRIGAGKIGAGNGDGHRTGRHDSLDFQVVDRDVVMPRAGVEIKDEMRDHGAGEIPGGAMFGPQRRQALSQRRGNVGDAEGLPAIGTARHVSRHEDGHRRAGPRRTERRQDDPGRKSDVGAVGPHPQRGPPFIDDPRRLERQLPAKGCPAGGVDHDPLAALAAVRSLRRSGMADDPMRDIGIADRPGGGGRLERLLHPARRGRGAGHHRQQKAGAENGRQGRIRQGHGEGRLGGIPGRHGGL